MTTRPDPAAGLAGLLIVAVASAGIVVLAAAVTLVGDPGTPIVGFVITAIAFGVLALGCLYRYARIIRFRRTALRDGTPVHGVVVGYGTAFNVFASDRSHTVVVGYRNRETDRHCAVRLPGRTRPDRFPPGSSVVGWLHPGGEAWFPLR